MIRRYSIRLNSIIFWLGFLFSAISWFITSGFYHYPGSPIKGLIWLTVGVLFLVLSSPAVRFSFSNPIRFVLVTLLVLGSILLGIPYNIGCLLLLAYIILYDKFKVSRILFIPGITISIQLLFFQLIWILAPNLHQLQSFKYLTYLILKVLMVDAYINNGQLLIKAADTTQKFLITYDMLGIWFLILLIIAPIILSLIGLFGQKTSRLVSKIIIITVIYSFIRLLLLILSYFYFGDVKLFVGELQVLVTLIPLAMILGYLFIPVDNLHLENIGTFKFVPQYAFAINILLIISLMAVLVTDPGKIKNNKVLIDDSHCAGWESVDEPLDTKNFGGQKSTYTYTAFVKFLANFYQVDIARSADDFNKLDKYDILILKTPQKPYTPAEINKVTRYVINGGSLFLIGDHTNLFGMNDYLNNISSQWGIKFNSDALYDLYTTGLTEFSPPPFFKHSIILDIDQYKFATSCSLQTNPLVTRPVMIGNGLCSENMDISHVNFFGDMTPDPEDRWGVFNQCVARYVSKGRVIAFSDSTTFSSFSVLMHKNPQFILGIMEFLNRSNLTVFILVKKILLYSLIPFLLLNILLRIPYKQKAQSSFLLFLVIISLIPCLAIADYCATAINSINYQQAVSSKLNNLDTVFFDRQHSTENISHFIGMGGINDHHNYSSFFIDFQRLGYFVREGSFEEFMNSKSDTLIIINPNIKYSAQELEILQQFVGKGGKIVICCTSRNDTPALSNLLKNFNLNYFPTFTIGQEKIQQPKKTDETATVDNSHVIAFTPAFNISGYGLENRKFKIKQSTKFKDLYLISTDYKKGHVYILGDSFNFSNKVLGDPGLPPTETQYQLHQEIFKLIKEL